MKLLTKEHMLKIPNLYEIERSLNPICHIKLFTPDAQWRWFIIEICKETNDICYGYIKGLDDELGYFSLKELESIKGPLGLSIERDLYFKPTPLSILKKKY